MVSGENLLTDVDHVLDDPTDAAADDPAAPPGRRFNCLTLVGPLRLLVESSVVRLLCLYVFLNGLGDAAPMSPSMCLK